MKRLLLVCGMAALIAAPVAFAGNSFPLQFFLLYSQTAQQVSQQPAVINPTWTDELSDPPQPPACLWDAADYLVRNAGINSVLESGASVSDSWCVFQDAAPRSVTTQIASDSSALRLEVNIRGTSTLVSPVFDKRLNLWSYKSCTPIPPYTGSDTIPGSNGGIGELIHPGVTLSNPTKRSIGKIRYDWDIWPGACA